LLQQKCEDVNAWGSILNENTTGEELSASDLQSGRLSDFAYSSIKEQLARGAYKPGHKLPIRSVAEMLNVGATPAREAINRLVFEGALVMVGPKTVIVPHLDLAALYEVTQMRLALEGLATEKGALRSTDDIADKLLALQEKITLSLDESATAMLFTIIRNSTLRSTGCARCRTSFRPLRLCG
jgi:DNA-binding GntR family transcriptional regulator